MSIAHLMEMVEFDFDSLTPRAFQFRYDGTWYALREASESVAKEWQLKNMRSLKMDDSGNVVSYEGWPDSEAFLVAACLTRLDDDRNPARDAATGLPLAVTLAAVKMWPARVVGPLFERVRTMSDLGTPDPSPEQVEKELDALEKKIDGLTKKLATGREKLARTKSIGAGGTGGSGGGSGSSSSDAAPNASNAPEDPAKNEPSATAATSA